MYETHKILFYNYILLKVNYTTIFTKPSEATVSCPLHFLFLFFFFSNDKRSCPLHLDGETWYRSEKLIKCRKLLSTYHFCQPKIIPRIETLFFGGKYDLSRSPFKAKNASSEVSKYQKRKLTGPTSKSSISGPSLPPNQAIPLEKSQ